MIKRMVVLFSLNLFLSCSNTVDLNQLEGYWEIDEVRLEDGNKREYTVNNTIDFIELNSDSTGFRKKLKPQFDGTFKTSDKFETIKITDANGSLIIEYQTPFMQWNEEIIKLNAEELILKNQQSIRYIYKRYKPLNLE